MKTTPRIRDALEKLLPRYERTDPSLHTSYMEAPYICVNLRKELGYSCMLHASESELGYADAAAHFGAAAFNGCWDNGYAVRAAAIRKFLEETAE